MLQVNAATGRGAASAVRWLVRALLVISGAVLGTAAAWLIGDATASAAQLAPAPADAAQDDVATPITDRVIGATDDLTWGVSDFVGNATATAVKYGMAGGPADPARGEEAAADMGRTVHSFTRDALLRPIQRTLGTAEHIGRKPQDAPQVIGDALAPAQRTMPDFTKVWNFLHPKGKGLIKLPSLGDTADTPAAPEPAPQVPPVAIADDVMGPIAENVPGTSAGDTRDVTTHDRGAKHTHGEWQDEFPLPPHGPLAPAGVPLAPGGTATGGHIDGLLFGVPAGGPAVRGSDDTVSVRFVYRHTPVEPGEQPGVTPD